MELKLAVLPAFPHLRLIRVYVFRSHINSNAHGFQTRHLRKYFEENSDEYDIFRHQLKQVGRLLDPIARGLKTLEGQQVTCSDVFFIWIGLGVAFKRAFSNPGKFVLVGLILFYLNVSR